MGLYVPTLLKRSVTLLRRWSSDFVELRLWLIQKHQRCTLQQKDMHWDVHEVYYPLQTLPSRRLLSTKSIGLRTLIKLNIIVGPQWSRSNNRDILWWSLVTDEIVQHWSRRPLCKVLVIKQSCSIVDVDVEGRMSWGFRGDRDFRTVSWWRWSFRTSCMARSGLLDSQVWVWSLRRGDKTDQLKSVRRSNGEAKSRGGTRKEIEG
jgi:hypothetical protein